MTNIRYADTLRDRVAELRSERTGLNVRLRALLDVADRGGVDALSSSDVSEMNRLNKRAAEIDAELSEATASARDLDALESERAAVPRGPDFIRNGPDDDGRGHVTNDAGRRAIDAAFRSGLLPDFAAERATALIESGRESERSLASRWAAAAGSPAYRSAFAKVLSDPTRGHLLWDAREQDAYRQVAAVQSEMESRTSMSTTAGNGGYLIPLTLDPAILLTNAGSNNPLRQLATVKRTLTNSWTGITSAGATSEWKTELAQAADGAPEVASPSIDTFLGDTFVPYSFEVGMDAENFLSELTAVMTDSLDQLHATAFTTGDGVNAPQGIVTGLVGTASEINGGGVEAIIAADAFTLQNALPARFSANATWQAHIATMNAFRQFETTNGALQFPELRDNPPHLLGKEFHENSNMDGSLNAAVTENNYLAIYGDVAAGYFIVDRVGATLELIPNLMGANGRPTGERGAFLWARTGAQVVLPQALRLLDIPTTA